MEKPKQFAAAAPGWAGAWRARAGATRAGAARAGAMAKAHGVLWLSVDLW